MFHHSLVDPNDLAFLMNHLQPVAHHWKNLSLQLGIEPAEQKAIESIPLLVPGGPAAFLQEMLRKHLSFAPPSHAYIPDTCMCDALRNPAVGVEGIVQEIEKE